MKAIVQSWYGSPSILELEELDKPVPEANEVLVRVRGASVNPLDWHDMRGVPYFLRMGSGLLKPKKRILGADVAGQVETVGKNVTQFQPGDKVFGVCKGAFAEYARCREDRLLAKPANLTFEQAAGVPVAALTALQSLRDRGQVESGQRVLIVGASGGVGTFAVQIAKSFGAEVTGVCSTTNLDLVQSIGADHIIDYSQKDFTRSGQRYDLIVDMAGAHPLSECRRALTPRGTYVVVGAPSGKWLAGPDRFIKALALSPFVSQRMVPFIAAVNKEDLVALKDLIDAGEVTPVIDRTYPLIGVPDAVRYLEGGHARGKVVISLAPTP